MMRYYSIGMKLNDVIKDGDTEQVVLENIKRCSNVVGKEFKVVFWHHNLKKSVINDFVKRKLVNFLHKNPEIRDLIFKKILQAEKDRKELAGIKNGTLFENLIL